MPATVRVSRHSKKSSQLAGGRLHFDIEIKGQHCEASSAGRARSSPNHLSSNFVLRLGRAGKRPQARPEFELWVLTQTISDEAIDIAEELGATNLAVQHLAISKTLDGKVGKRRTPGHGLDGQFSIRSRPTPRPRRGCPLHRRPEHRPLTRSPRKRPPDPHKWIATGASGIIHPPFVISRSISNLKSGGLGQRPSGQNLDQMRPILRRRVDIAIELAEVIGSQSGSRGRDRIGIKGLADQGVLGRGSPFGIFGCAGDADAGRLAPCRLSP